MKYREFSIKASLKFLFITLTVTLLCSCTTKIVPSQYDVRLSTELSELTVEAGGEPLQVDVCLNSYRYRELSSEQNVFLSYHILSSNGEVIVFDGTRSILAPIAARGKKKENVEITAPIDSGEYIVEIDLVEEGVTWFSQQGMETIKLPLTVRQTYISEFNNISIKSEIDQLDLIKGDAALIPIIISNNGSMPLYSKGEMAVHASYHISYGDGHELIYDGIRTDLPCAIAPGTREEFCLRIDSDSFQIAGNYIITVDLVIEGTNWFSQKGMDVIKIPVTFALNNSNDKD